MEPLDALRSIETALRLVIRDVLGEDWIKASGAPDVERLNERREEEDRRRDGAVVSSSLLDYTEIYHLSALILNNWERFQPAFRDKRRTQVFLGVVEDVRNTVAHSRILVPFERDLISGIAGQLRNQVSLYRSSENQSSRYYPLIESVTDSFGTEGGPEYWPLQPAQRLEVGTVLTFAGTAFNVKSKRVDWELLPATGETWGTFETPVFQAGEGDSVAMQYTVTDRDVSELFGIIVRIKTDSRYHRHMGIGASFDDHRFFLYAVNPPNDNS